MIKEALEYIAGLNKAEIITIEGRTFTDKALKEITENVIEKPIQVRTLDAVIDYIAGNVDEILSMEDKIIVQVVNHQQVEVYGSINEELKRNNYLIATAMCPEAICYGRYYDAEEFNIMLQSRFEASDDKDLLLQVTGNIKDENVRNISDDGVTQAVTVKTGVTQVNEVVVPNPVTLTPMRTFYEVQQPSSKFIFRMRKGPECALFEADGGAWKQDAMQGIALYLLNGLKERLTEEAFNKLTILS